MKDIVERLDQIYEELVRARQKQKTWPEISRLNDAAGIINNTILEIIDLFPELDAKENKGKSENAEE